MDGKKKPPNADERDERELDAILRDEPPTDEEIAESARLRDALADPSKGHPDADLARALSLAHAPRDLDDAEHRAIVARGVAEGSRRAKLQRRGVVVRLAFGVSAVAAIAASVLVALGVRAPEHVDLAVTRSTQPLFAERFPQVGGESARIDRIAMARSADLRENRFARWGVR